jgi:hypothetical protein
MGAVGGPARAAPAGRARVSTMNHALLFRDALRETILEATHSAPRPADTVMHDYLAFLMDADSRLVEAGASDLGAQHHDFLQDLLSHLLAARVAPEGVPFGAVLAYGHLADFTAGVNDMVHAFESRPRKSMREPVDLVLELLRAHGRATRETDPPALQELVRLRQPDVEDLQSAWKERRTPWSLIEHQLTCGIDARSQELEQRPPVGTSAEDWGRECESARARLQGYCAGAVRALTLTHPGMARHQAWEHLVLAGRLAPHQVEGANWWVKPALGVLGALRGRTYWDRTFKVDIGPAWESALAIARTAAEGQRAMLAAPVTDDLAQRLNAFILGLLEAKEAAHRLPDREPASWLDALKRTRQGKAMDVDELASDAPEADMPTGASPIRRLHDHLALRFCHRRGMNAILPEDPAAAQLLGFLLGHHIHSVPLETNE